MDADVMEMVEAARAEHAKLRDMTSAALDMLDRVYRAIDRGDLKSAVDYQNEYDAICRTLGVAPRRRIV